MAAHDEGAASWVGGIDAITLFVEDVHVARQFYIDAFGLLNGPIDRPWGLRTASFQDPDGHVWEIAHNLAQA